MITAAVGLGLESLLVLIILVLLVVFLARRV